MKMFIKLFVTAFLVGAVGFVEARRVANVSSRVPNDSSVESVELATPKVLADGIRRICRDANFVPKDACAPQDDLDAVCTALADNIGVVTQFSDADKAKLKPCCSLEEFKNAKTKAGKAVGAQVCAIK